MRILQFDSILLFALVVPFIMGYRIGPGDTPFASFGLIFLLLLGYVAIDLFKLSQHQYERAKNILLWIVVVFVIGSGFFSAIVVRHQVAPIFNVHDIILQQEAAIRFLLDGRNPYQETYFGTPLEDWHYHETEVNPALYHFVMQPWYLLFPLPFYVLSNQALGYFDARIPLVFLFFVSAVVAFLLGKNGLQKRLFVVLLMFHPSLLTYTLEGRSDIFLYGFFITSVYFLLKKKGLMAAVFLALAFAVKQSIWPLSPFYIAYLWFTKKSMGDVVRQLVTFVIVFCAIVLPFFLWNQQAFLSSTVLYLSGQTEHAYPVSGYGIGALLLEYGFIAEKSAYYPFVIWQLVFCVPLLGLLLWYLKKHPTVKRMVLVYGIFLFVFWYLSRYFNNSHLGYLSLLFITSYFIPESGADKDDKQNNKREK